MHPAKLATDAGFAVISLYFFWQHQLTRLIGDFITIIAAWFHSPTGIAAGLIVVLASLIRS